MTPAVDLEGVRVVVPARVLLHVPRLVVHSGEQVAIVGPNGAGKTTLLKVMGAQLAAQEGLVQVLGHALAPTLGTAHRRALRCEVGFLMQGLHLVPRLSALENVLIGALGSLRGAQALRSLLRWYPSARVDEALGALAAMGLAGHANTRADQLSGGERQKVALARLQMQGPRLLLVDEPTSALDPAATALVCQALHAMASEPGRTLITVVHDLNLLPLLATRVIGMADGRVQWDEPISKVTAERLKTLYEHKPSSAVNAATQQAPPIGRLAGA